MNLLLMVAGLMSFDYFVRDGVVGPQMLIGEQGRSRMISSPLNGFYNVMVACAAAHIPFKRNPNFRLGGVRVVFEQVSSGHDHAGRAKPTLQPMAFFEAFLKRMQLCVALGQTLNGRYVATVSLGGQ
jgi:hypothetical protein